MRNAVVAEGEKYREAAQKLMDVELRKLEQAENGKLTHFPDEKAIDAKFSES
jgi:hypothetical protein